MAETSGQHETPRTDDPQPVTNLSATPISPADLAAPIPATASGVLGTAAGVPEKYRNLRIQEAAPLPAVKSRELLGLVAAIIIWDFTIYQGGGFAGWAVLLGLLACIVMTCSAVRNSGKLTGFILGLLLVLCARLVWQGHGVSVATGFALLMALVITINGHIPYLPESIAFSVQTLFGGIASLIQYIRSSHFGSRRIERSVSVPVIIGCAFILVFLLANPDMVSRVVEIAKNFLKRLPEFMPSSQRIGFWLLAAWITAGMLRVHVDRGLVRSMSPGHAPAAAPTSAPEPMAYSTARNTLLTVVALFAIYLTYEIAYMVVREIPQGFYYSGYAHRGAFWLTVALAFSTFTLGFVMRHGMLAHPRASFLRWLTWIWTVENLILAGCVFHRLHIYVDFNGMSRMRVVASYGVAAVVIGFILAVIKVMKERPLLWLIRSDLWALFAIIYLWTLTPVDWFVTRYNVREILAGNLSPSVQLGWHSIGAEGIPLLVPLAQSEDQRIRRGARALLADAYARFSEAEDWTDVQLAARRALRVLNENRPFWSEYSDPGAREAALSEFKSFTWQWY